jgi:diguanylate cyclase (GGDEF)-like protein
MLPTVLIVEDSALVTKIIRHVATQIHNFSFVYAESFAQTKAILENREINIFAALVDLNLPDAPDGEVVDYVLGKGINTIVLTATFDEQRREKLLAKGIVDYVTKEGRFSYQYALSLVERIHQNQSIKVMVVDDSDTSRYFIKNLLAQHLFVIEEAKNGIEAVKVLLANPDIKLLITDYQMPQMDGLELVQNIRHKYEKSDLAIIGLSGEGQGALSAKFIKAGANDFLHKPFNHEEFHCRVRHTIEALEHIEQIRDAANRDYLTGVYNRRYFFASGSEIYRQAQTNKSSLAAAVLDLDHFKKINDTYGYEGGDKVLQEVTQILEDSLERFLVARPSGEEFFVLMPGLDNAKAIALIKRVHDIVNETPIAIGEDTLYVSFSAGVSNHLSDSLSDQLNTANGYLYRAKEAGRNLVIGDD